MVAASRIALPSHIVVLKFDTYYQISLTKLISVNILPDSVD